MHKATDHHWNRRDLNDYGEWILNMFTVKQSKGISQKYTYYQLLNIYASIFDRD